MKDKPYFKHDCDARIDSRVIKIREKYGAKGYGIYFMLIEMLRSSQNYEVIFDANSLAFDIHEDKEIIQDIIKNYDLFCFRKDKFFSKSLKERMGNLDKLRENWQKKANKRWSKKAPALTPEQVRNIQ